MGFSIDEADIAGFKEDVVEYLRLPEQIQQAEEPIKLLKARQKELQRGIINFMNTRQITHCNCPEETGGGVIVVTASTTKSTIKKEHWKKGVEELAKKRGLDLSFDQVEAEVNATRELVTKHTLKRRKK